MPTRVQLLEQLATDNSTLKLPAKEKQRRGVAMDRLVFLTLHDVAQSWWCAMYAVRKARDFRTRLRLGAQMTSIIGLAFLHDDVPDPTKMVRAVHHAFGTQ